MTYEEYTDFLLANVHKQSNCKFAHLIIESSRRCNLVWNDNKKTLVDVTFSSVYFPNSNFDILFSKTIDEGLDKCEKYSHVIVSSIGCVYEYKEIYECFFEFVENEEPCRGHIMAPPDHSYVWLHEQSIFLNLVHWRKIGRPSFGRYSGYVRGFDRSKENIHHDYTPYWIKPNHEKIKVQNFPQSEYISKVLEDGKEIKNFFEERNHKFFLYPKDTETEDYRKLCRERNVSKPLFFINTSKTWKESFRLVHDKGVRNRHIKYDVIYCVASGAISEYLLTNYGHKHTKLVIFDYNEYILEWKKNLHIIKDVDIVNKHFEFKINRNEIKNVYINRLPAKFGSNHNDFDWNKSLEEIDLRNVEYQKIDVLVNNFDINEDKRNLIFLSNIFNYMPMFLEYSFETMLERQKYFYSIPNSVIASWHRFNLPWIIDNLNRGD